MYVSNKGGREMFDEDVKLDLKKKSGAPEKYPFSKLEIGDSFPIPETTTITSMRTIAYQRGVALGRKFKVSVKTRIVERTA